MYSLSLTARGTGAVGEMTSLLAGAYDDVRNARKAVSRGKATSAVILLIDEADAIAQSRELAQMHHEDRAGVNAVIRGVDDLARGRFPALIVMCTNRLDAIDPALRRRAALVFDAFPDKAITFERARDILEKTPPTPPFSSQAD